MENWKKIRGFSNYSVSDLGNVRNDCFNRLLKPRTNKRGYKTVDLHVLGDPYPKYVHVLVAEAFIGPCPIGQVVDHIDNNPSNNALSNLHYVTQSYNVTKGKGKPVGRYDENGVLLEEYPCVRCVIGFYYNEVSRACHSGKRYRGFYWRFLNQ